MLALHPDNVRLMGESLGAVESIAIDRRAERLLVERGDTGPHAVFVDAAEVRVTATLVRALEHGDDGALRPGMSGSLRFETAPGASGARRRVWEADVVIASVEHEVGTRRSARQRVVMVAVSADGAADPVRVEGA